MYLILVCAAAVVAYLWYERRRELFVVSVRDGRALLVRGRLPTGLAQAIQDIVSTPPVRRARIRAYKDENRARLTATGMGGSLEQRLRNVFSIHPISALVAAPPINQRSVGQFLGIAWLAWMLDRTRGG
jgi:hypothetical protein